MNQRTKTIPEWRNLVFVEGGTPIAPIETSALRCRTLREPVSPEQLRSAAVVRRMNWAAGLLSQWLCPHDFFFTTESGGKMPTSLLALSCAASLSFRTTTACRIQCHSVPPL
jgi:hypothetical protein